MMYELLVLVRFFYREEVSYLEKHISRTVDSTRR